MNHSGDTNKMVRECVSNEQVTGEATPNEELRRQILSPHIGKNEREWWAAGTIEKLEFELNAANQHIKQLEDARTVAAANSLANMLAYEDAVAKIKRLEEAVQERDKEWFQVIESILGFHPVSMTEALRIGIERIKKQKQRIKQLEAVVNDPEALWTNWLRGTVKLPSGIGDVRQYQERIKRLEEALDLVIPNCSWVHHSKKHQHKCGEPCPVVALIEKAKEAKP